jgi:hypothetical protein
MAKNVLRVLAFCNTGRNTLLQALLGIAIHTAATLGIAVKYFVAISRILSKSFCKGRPPIEHLEHFDAMTGGQESASRANPTEPLAASSHFRFFLAHPTIMALRSSSYSIDSVPKDVRFYFDVRHFDGVVSCQDGPAEQ